MIARRIREFKAAFGSSPTERALPLCGQSLLSNPHWACLKIRTLGYEGVVSPSTPQRQSGTSESSSQTGFPGEMHHRGIDADEEVEGIEGQGRVTVAV